MDEAILLAHLWTPQVNVKPTSRSVHGLERLTDMSADHDPGDGGDDRVVIMRLCSCTTGMAYRSELVPFPALSEKPPKAYMSLQS